MRRGSSIRRTGKGPSQVSGLDEHLGFWLRFVSNHVSASFARRVEENGVSVSEWVALRALYDEPTTTTRSLVAALGMTKGAVSKLVDKLEQKELARREPHPEDRRAQLVSLTRAGRKLVPKLARLADENDAYYFACLRPEQRCVLAETLQELVRRHRLTQVPTQ